jgi:DNA-binding response OmpR family regulator
MNSLGDIEVLIVDDNQQMRMLTRALLRAAGVARIAEAGGALEASDYLHRAPADLILVDWKMQPVDGIAFTKMVRLSADSPCACAPILMMTAHTEVSRVAAARDAGVTGFLRKPISARILFERMSAALLDERLFIRTDGFFGPDRRHGVLPSFAGPFRRASDRATQDTLDVDDVRHSA